MFYRLSLAHYALTCSIQSALKLFSIGFVVSQKTLPDWVDDKKFGHNISFLIKKIVILTAIMYL